MDEAQQHDQDQLTIQRRNVGYLLEQATQFGGEVMTPLAVRNQLHAERTAIATLKARPHVQNVSVADEPDDFPPAQADALRAQELLDAMPLDGVPNPAPLPDPSRMPYAPNPHFVGRDDALLTLATALKGGGRVSLGPRAAATGLGGIDKTSVACQLAI